MATTALQDQLIPDNPCFGCGPDNPDGLRIKSFVEGDELVAEWVPEARFQGPPGVVNGGVMAIPMDCHATWTAMHAFSADRGRPVKAVTAGYSVRLIAPTPIGRRVLLCATTTERSDRKAKVHVSATVDGTEVATFDGTFVVVDEDASAEVA